MTRPNASDPRRQHLQGRADDARHAARLLRPRAGGDRARDVPRAAHDRRQRGSRCPASPQPRSGSSPSPAIAVVLSAFASGGSSKDGWTGYPPGTLTQEGNGVRLWLIGPVPARALGRRLGRQSRRDDPLAPRRGDGLGQDAAVRLVGVRVVGGDDRARAARRDRARPDPARAPVPRLVRLLPHRRPDRQAVADLAVRAVVRLRRARAGRRDPGGDRGGVRRPRDRKRADARAGARRHRRPHARPRALPRLRRRHRQEAERRAADPRGDRDDPLRRRARAARRRRSGRPAASIRWTAPMLFAGGAIVLFAIGLLSALALAIFGNSRDWRGTAFGVAHAHYLLWGTALLALLGGLTYWWPKVFGRLLGTRLTAWSAWLLFIGFNCTFFVQFLLGDKGQPAGASSFSEHGSISAYNMISTIGAVVTGARRAGSSCSRSRGRTTAGARATTRGSATRSSGTRPRRRRRTTSTRVPRDHERAAARRPAPHAEGAQCALSARSDGVAPGPFLRGTIVAAAVATAVVVASATIDSGRGHWAAALVALPLLVAAVIIARIAYPRLLAATATALGLMLAAIATGGLVALVDDARWAVGAPRRRRRRLARGVARRARPLLPRRAGAARPLARLHHADEAADHVAAAHHRRGGDVRRRRGLARAAGSSLDDDGRARARLRRLERAQPRDGRRHRQADGRAHRRPPGCLGPRRRAAGARVRRRPDGPLVRACSRRR